MRSERRDKSKMSDRRETLTVVFTKDRPDRIIQTLPHFVAVRDHVIVLDDSSTSDWRDFVRTLCVRLSIEYHGPREQQELLSKLPNAQRFVRPLGHAEWSLGFNRNYALVLALSMGARTLLMSDDDILIEPADVVAEGHARAHRERLAAFDIVGMPDDSVVGHIYRAGGRIQARYASGTFLGIELHRVHHFFLNHYNEDWIWVFLQAHGAHIVQTGAVTQLAFHPFEHAEAKALFQEPGEVLWEGVSHTSPVDLHRDLMSCAYWKQILSMRRAALREISGLPLRPQERPIALAVRDRLLAFHHGLAPEWFVGVFATYFDAMPDWENLLELAATL